MLKTNTTTPALLEVLNIFMKFPELEDFRLVGGTALSLQLGHRLSVDIDLFTFNDTKQINFNEIENKIISLGFPFYSNTEQNLPDDIKNKNSLFIYVGESEDKSVKVDILNWSENFFFDEIKIDGIRMATIEEFAIMKLEIIGRGGGRKKDYWDLSEILETRTMKELLDIYKKKYYYLDIRGINNLTNFSVADYNFDPICLKGKFWDVIKTDFEKEYKALKVLGKSKGLSIVISFLYFAYYCLIN